MKKFIKGLIIAIFLVIIGCISFVILQSKPVSTFDENNSIRIEIPSGMSVTQVSNLLKNENLIKNSKLFYYCARFPFLRNILFSKDDNSINFILKSGIYYISPSMNIAQIQNLLSSGQQEFVKVSIPEGLTISKIAAILENNRICNSIDFIDSCHNSLILNTFNIPSESVEGFLFPDTYYLNIGMKADDVVTLFVQTFFEKIKEIDSLEGINPEKLYEIVTLASIVEREYRVPDEAPLIASVFRNRLKNNIGLYSCATIEYILTEIEGRPHPEKILIEDTKIDNPYNTYKWAGLPPGPISNPGLIAIDASANTPKTNYYFFQVADSDAGRHVFTSTFEQHKVNHNIYTKKAAGQ